MRRLLLMRHAKTEKNSPSGKDRDRRLDERGCTEAEQMGLYLARQQLMPGFALVSTAVRARQTWELISKAWPQGKRGTHVDFLDDLYAADSADLIRIIRATTGENLQTLLVIAHNPGLHELALTLTAEGNFTARQALLDTLPTSGIVVIDLAINDWSHVSFRRGRLERFVSPRLLKEASGDT